MLINQSNTFREGFISGARMEQPAELRHDILVKNKIILIIFSRVGNFPTVCLSLKQEIWLRRLNLSLLFKLNNLSLPMSLSILE